MGRRIVVLLLTVMMVTMTAGYAFADVPISAERTSVTNSLPSVTIYSDTDRDYGASSENTEVKVNDSETDIESVEVFKDSGEGATYFMLIDVSASLSEEDLALIKRSVKNFAGELSSNDRIYLISFGDMVYSQSEAFDPASTEFASAVDGLETKDDNTKLYEALGEVDSIVSNDKKASYPERNIAMIFTDGIDDTAGSLTQEEAVKKMVDAGIPLYAFAVGDDKEGKDSLGVLARACSGTLADIDESSADAALDDFHTVIEDTLVIKADVRNSSDIMDTFTVRVYVDGEELLVKEDVRSYKSEDTKDAFSVTAAKLLSQYWWVVLIAAVAVIAFIVLMVIKRNRGVVNVDGKIVYGSKVQKRYHVQVKEYNTREITIWASIDGSSEIKQDVTLVESVIVGRSGICDVYFDDAAMSRQHFSIEICDGELCVSDLNSTGGTYLNGVKIYSKQKLSRGDVITAGKTRIKISW